jgi:signal transduction histidine kinase
MTIKSRKALFLEIEAIESGHRIDSDPVRLCQIIANLLTNAAKYSPERAAITVVLDAKEDDALVSVRNAGMGIDAQMLPHIFELFLQGDRSLDRSQGGLGIGLTIVRHLVEMHGGSIRAESEGLGKGSAFIVRLPRVHREPELPLGFAPASHTRSSRRILIVEDNVDAAESLVLLLRMMARPR